MADELNTNTESVQPAEAEGAQVNGAVQPQPTQTQESANKPVNLFELPEFRNYQRQMDQRIAMLQQQAQAARAQVDQVAMANMDDFQKAQYAAQQAQARVQELQQELERRDLMQAKFERIQTVSRETGVPLEILNQAETPDDLAVIVAKHLKTNRQQQAQEETQREAEKAKANKVDLGSGKAQGGDARYNAALDEAFKKGDSLAYVRLLRKGKID